MFVCFLVSRLWLVGFVVWLGLVLLWCSGVVFGELGEVLLFCRCVGIWYCLGRGCECGVWL